jgi:hypothetical protein
VKNVKNRGCCKGGEAFQLKPTSPEQTAYFHKINHMILIVVLFCAIFENAKL